MKINSLYVTVKDMQRAIDFYQKFFGIELDRNKIEDRYNAFVVNGFYFGLYNPAVEGEELILGNNVVPNIEVDSAEETFNLVKELEVEIISEIKPVGSLKIFQFKDTEGNIIEIYSSN